ncbi:Arsenate reductase [hydrothermal vent metagenome]|uniref:Arsenate reductase n=1 Tax=hydrothermal vent metagenome TaxID=652676 RepID=A0A1W1E1T6_9ZZZZ
MTLAILEEKGVDFQVIKYLDNAPTAEELKALLKDLNMNARALMRTHEAPYKDNNLGDESLSEDDLIQAMINNPILIERPIVKTDKGVVIGRPPENVLAII